VSGDLDDLCPDQDVCNNGKDVLEERIVFQDVGHITERCIETPMLNKDNNLSFDSQVRLIPVDECLWTTQLTVEDHVLTWIGQVCHEANAPLYIVDEIMSIFQDEYNKGLCMDRLFFHKRESFMKHLLSQFATPKAHLLHIGIEGLHANNIEYRREVCDSVSVIYTTFWIRLMI